MPRPIRPSLLQPVFVGIEAALAEPVSAHCPYPSMIVVAHSISGYVR